MGACRAIRSRRLEAKVPLGVRTGSRIRLSGGRGVGYTGGFKGDLYLVVLVRPHEWFQGKDGDLHGEVEVPLITVVLVGEVEGRMLAGRVALKIPSETQNGQSIRLAGQGMPHTCGGFRKR